VSEQPLEKEVVGLDSTVNILPVDVHGHLYHHLRGSHCHHHRNDQPFSFSTLICMSVSSIPRQAAVSVTSRRSSLELVISVPADKTASRVSNDVLDAGTVGISVHRAHTWGLKKLIRIPCMCFVLLLVPPLRGPKKQKSYPFKWWVLFAFNRLVKTKTNLFNKVFIYRINSCQFNCFV
jgi:hypothetical protein